MTHHYEQGHSGTGLVATVTTSRILGFVVALCAILFAFGATAEPRDDAAREKTTSVMQDYFAKGNFARAEAILLGILKACEEQCNSTVKATVWIDIGITRAAAHDSEPHAIDAFSQALALDPAVRLDMSYADSHAVALYKRAKGASSSSKAAAAAPAAQAVAPVATAAPAPQPPVVTAPASTGVPPAGTGAASPATATCFPACRKGFVCARGQCVSICNPPCAAHETCTAAGQCISAAAVRPTTAAPASSQPQVSSLPAPSSPAPAQPATPLAPPKPVVPTAQPIGVPITFESSSNSEATTVTVTQAGRAQSCTTPCSLNLQPGIASVAIKGRNDFNSILHVPSSPSRVEISFRRKGQLWAGIIVEGVGLVMLSVETAKASSYGSDSITAGDLGVAAVGAIVSLVGVIVVCTSGSDSLAVESKARSGVALRTVGVAPLQHGGAVLGASFAF